MSGKTTENKTDDTTKAQKKRSTGAASSAKSDKAAKSVKKAAEKPAKAEQAEKAEKAEKKPAAKKTAAKSEKKNQTSETAKKVAAKSEKSKPKPKSRQDKPEPNSRTPQVMKLMEQRTDVVNPTILAGKSSIPKRLRGIEPLSKIMRREAEDLLDTGEQETYNITALVIDEQAADILRRFNACDCEVCIEQFSALAAEQVPARFVKLKKSAVERNTHEVEKLKEPLRQKVTQTMIRLVIANKKRSYHD